jgi:hypothetical protein
LPFKTEERELRHRLQKRIHPMHLNQGVKNSGDSKLLGLVFIFAALTPFTHWGTNTLDSQPWPFATGLIYLLLSRKISTSSEIKYIAVLVSIFVPSILIINWPGQELAMRAFGSYFTLSICALAYYNYLIKNGIPTRMIYSVNALYLVLGFAELIYPDINSGLSASRTSEGRGVTSLAAEPTYFAIILIFFSWLQVLAVNYKPNKMVFTYLVLNTIGVVFLSKSTMGLLFLTIAFGSALVWKLTTLRIQTIVYIVSIVVSTYFLSRTEVIYEFFGSRMLGVFEAMGYNGIYELFYNDESMNIRLSNVVYSFDGMVRNYFLPGGFNTFGDYRIVQDKAYNGYFWAGETSDKIGSYLGSICYELGIFGLFVIATMVKAIAFKRTVLSLLECAVYLIFAAAAIPLAFAPLHLVFATLIYVREQKRTKPINYDLIAARDISYVRK